MADDMVDRSTGDPIVNPIDGLTVVPMSGGFDISWNASTADEVEYYEISRSDGKTFRTTSTVLQDTYELVPFSLYLWSVSVHAGKKSSVPVSTDKFQF